MLNQFFFLILHVFYWLECKRLFEKDFNNSHFGPEVKLMHNCCIFISSSAFFTSLSLFSATISASTLSKEVIPGCQALVQVQSSPSRRTRVESMVPTAHHHHHHHHRKLFKKFVEWNLYSIKSQKILSYIIIPTAHHHHHHHHRKLFKFLIAMYIQSRVKRFCLIL